MKNSNILAVDAMGGDFGPSVVVPGALKAGQKCGAKILLVGIESAIQEVLDTLPDDLKTVDFSIVHASQVVDMHEKPSDILRQKKDSSIQVACRLVKDGKAHSVISAGHSGACVACGMFIIGRISGVERPCLATIMPTKTTPRLVLDVGANVECKPHHLFQFALMGSAFAKDILGYEEPSVGILSIGEEEGKGTCTVKEAYDLLKVAHNINFVGNVEGRDIFIGNVDVIVCDGFVGNIALKLSEGLALSLFDILKRELLGNGLLPNTARRRFWVCKAAVLFAMAPAIPVLLKMPSLWRIHILKKALITVCWQILKKMKNLQVMPVLPYNHEYVLSNHRSWCQCSGKYRIEF